MFSNALLFNYLHHPAIVIIEVKQNSAVGNNNHAFR